MFSQKNSFSLRENFTISKIIKSYKSYQKPLIDMFNPSSYRILNSKKSNEMELEKKNNEENNKINIKKEHLILEKELKKI